MWWLIIVGCGAAGEDAPDPLPLVMDEALDAGDVYVDGPARTVTGYYRNEGDVDLSFTSVSLEPEGGVFALVDWGYFGYPLAPGMEMPIYVDAAPVEEGRASGELVFVATDGREARFPVTVNGVGPVFSVSPGGWQPSAQYGCPTSTTFTVVNDGVDTEPVSAIVLGGAGDFVADAPEPATLAPGEAGTVVVTYAPVPGSYVSSTLRVGPVHELTLAGTVLFDTMARETFTQPDPPQDSVVLVGTPLDGYRLEITVDGHSSSAWSFDESRNAVVFSEVPVAGARIVVAYYRDECPDEG